MSRAKPGRLRKRRRERPVPPQLAGHVGARARERAAALRTASGAGRRRLASPRSRTTTLSGTSASTRFCDHDLVPPMRHPASVAALDPERLDEPPERRSVSDAEVVAGRTRARAQLARTSVERPIPLGAVTSGVAPPTTQADACRGARPRVPAHQRAGYCSEDRPCKQMESRPQQPSCCPVSRRRTPAKRELGPLRVCRRACRSKPDVQAFSITSSPAASSRRRASSSIPAARCRTGCAIGLDAHSERRAAGVDIPKLSAPRLRRSVRSPRQASSRSPAARPRYRSMACISAGRLLGATLGPNRSASS